MYIIPGDMEINETRKKKWLHYPEQDFNSGRVLNVQRCVRVLYISLY
jgi:hypothetical protein